MTISPGRAVLLANIAHAEFLRWVLHYAKRQGWRVKCDHDSRTEHWQSDSGWPDIFMVRGVRAVAMELKVGRDRMKRTQVEWKAALAATGVETYVFRPTDEDEIRVVLT